MFFYFYQTKQKFPPFTIFVIRVLSEQFYIQSQKTKQVTMKQTVPIIFILLIITAIHSCKQQADPVYEPVVSVSITPLEYFIDRLTDKALDVNVMIPPGASHATYSPTTSQFRKLSDSGIYFRIEHLGYEQAWVNKLSDMNPGMLLVNLMEGLEIIRGEEIDHGDHVHEGGIDPHIWMSPAVILKLLPGMKQAIIETYPDLQKTVSANYDVLIDEVSLLDHEMMEVARSLSRKRFMIFHPALTYLARDYGLEQIAVERGGKEPSPAMLSHIIREARKHDIPVIFIQREFDIRSADLISRETGAEIVQINPLAYDWTNGMRELMDLFKTRLH